MLVALVLAACGASATPAPSSAPVAGAPGSPGATPAAGIGRPPRPTRRRNRRPPPVAETTPAAPSDDRPLEERLPDEYGGVTLQKVSLSGEGAIDKAAVPLLEKYGKTPADVLSASAFGGGDVIFIALRVRGLGEDAMRELMVTSAGLGVVEVEVEELRLGGQAVYKTTVPGAVTHGYFVVRGDTAFGVTTASDEVAAGALAAIP